jgi:hypothetical protein
MIMEKNTFKIASMALALSIGVSAAYVQAKLPAPAPLTDEQKAKAEEAKAKAAEGAKKEADLLAKYQDKAADNFRARSGVKASATVVSGSATAPALEAKKP